MFFETCNIYILFNPSLAFRSESKDWNRIAKKISSKGCFFMFDGNMESLHNTHIFNGMFTVIVTSVSYN
jgi:hypothetical protein